MSITFSFNDMSAPPKEFYLYYSQHKANEDKKRERSGGTTPSGKPYKATYKVARVPDGKGGFKEVGYNVASSKPPREIKGDALYKWGGNKADVKFLRTEPVLYTEPPVPPVRPKTP